MFNHFRQPPLATNPCCVQCFFLSDDASTGEKLSVQGRLKVQKTVQRSDKPIFKK